MAVVYTVTYIGGSCGKLLKSENEVQLHATRSGHTNFSESTEEVKPLTEEEKKAQLDKYCRSVAKIIINISMRTQYMWYIIKMEYRRKRRKKRFKLI